MGTKPPSGACEIRRDDDVVVPYQKQQAVVSARICSGVDQRACRGVQVNDAAVRGDVLSVDDLPGRADGDAEGRGQPARIEPLARAKRAEQSGVQRCATERKEVGGG